MTQHWEYIIYQYSLSFNISISKFIQLQTCPPKFLDFNRTQELDLGIWTRALTDLLPWLMCQAYRTPMPDIKMLTRLSWSSAPCDPSWWPHGHWLTGEFEYLMTWWFLFLASSSSLEVAGQHKWPEFWYPENSPLHRDILPREVLVYWEVKLLFWALLEHSLTSDRFLIWSHYTISIIWAESECWERSEGFLRERAEIYSLYLLCPFELICLKVLSSSNCPSKSLLMKLAFSTMQYGHGQVLAAVPKPKTRSLNFISSAG